MKSFLEAFLNESLWLRLVLLLLPLLRLFPLLTNRRSDKGDEKEKKTPKKAEESKSPKVEKKEEAKSPKVEKKEGGEKKEEKEKTEEEPSFFSPRSKKVSSLLEPSEKDARIAFKGWLKETQRKDGYKLLKVYCQLGKYREDFGKAPCVSPFFFVFLGGPSLIAPLLRA